MRVFISIIFLIASTLIGVILSVNYSKKTKFYTYFLSFHKKYLNELNFSLKTLISLIDELDCDNDFNLLLIGYVKDKNFNCKLNYLSEEELNLIKSYFENLGLFDKNTQLNLYNGFTLKIEKLYENAIQEEKKYKNLYIKVGFLIGLIGLILFI